MGIHVMTGRRSFTRCAQAIVGAYLVGCASTPCEETLTCRTAAPEAQAGHGGQDAIAARAGAAGSPVAGHDGSTGGRGAGGTRTNDEEQGGDAGQAAIGPASPQHENGGEAGEAGHFSAAISPRVLAISPRDGAVGIASNELVQLEFSKAMDPESVANALTLGHFLPADLKFTWNAKRTSLTIAPSGGFSYASGSDDTILPQSFEVALGTEARSEDGAELDAPFESTFSTLRRITLSAEPTVYGWDTYGGTANEKTHPCESGDDTVYAGTFANMAVSGTNYTFIAFDAGAIGEPSAIVMQGDARLSAVQLDPTGSFYDGGAVVLQKVAYGSVDNEALSLPVTEDFGAFVGSASTSRPSVDVTQAFWDDYTQMGQRQLYRLSPMGNEDNTRALFRCDGFALEVTYLIP